MQVSTYSSNAASPRGPAVPANNGQQQPQKPQQPKPTQANTPPPNTPQPQDPKTKEKICLGWEKMDIKNVIDTISVEKHDFSVLLVDPKPIMLERLSEFVKGKRLEKLRLYYPEANSTVIIPRVDRFGAQGPLEDFINRMKPILLRVELRRFQMKPDDFGHPITAETFDKFFTVSIREAVRLMSDFDLSAITS